MTLYIFITITWLQSLVGVAGGATRAALTVHQARRDNMADISAKDGSQVLSLATELRIFLYTIKKHQQSIYSST